MKKLFTLLLSIISISAFAQTPFAYYPMNGDGNDASGNNKNGVVAQVAPELDRNNKPNAALFFSAANGSEFKVNDTTGFGNGNGSVSVAAWFKTFNTGINSIFTSGMQGFAKGIFMSVNYIFYDGSIAFALAGESGTGSLIFVCSKNKYNDDVWHHVAMVVDKNTNIATMYVDGKKEKLQKFSGFGQTGKGNLNSDSTELDISGLLNSSTPTQSYIGIGTSSGVSQNFSGILDEVYYFKSALTANQVASLFNGTASGIRNNNAERLFSVYPNPSNGIFNLKNNSGKASTVRVMDSMGKELKSFTTEGLYDSIDLSDLPNGMYLLKFEDGASVKIIRN